MTPSVGRYIALAQAAIDHALYFIEVEDNGKATAYSQFAAQQLQSLSKLLVQADVIDHYLVVQKTLEYENPISHS